MKKTALKINTVLGTIRIILCIGTIMLLCVQKFAAADTPIRIVIVPTYVERGSDMTDDRQLLNHYRRLIGFITNKLTRYNFLVIDPLATEMIEQENNRLGERLRKDSALGAVAVNKKYATDVAYIVNLKVNAKRSKDGYCRVQARVDGSGYDAGGRDIGATLSKVFRVTKRNCDDAIIEAETTIGDRIGRLLVASHDTGR